MALFDDKLVLFPSSKNATFILARRATRSGGESLHDVKGLTQNPDTLFMNAHKLVRVCEILPGAIWNQRIFQKLAAHDIRRQGGPTEVANKLDAMDAKHRESVQRTQDSDGDAINRAAYRSYKTRIGERLSLAKSQGRGDVIKQPVSVLVSKPQPAGVGH